MKNHTPEKILRHWHEFIGDALLMFYVRLYFFRRNPDQLPGMWARHLPHVTGNSMLGRYAVHHGISGANEVERMIFQKWSKSPDLAQEFVFSIVDFYLETLHRQ